MNENLHYASPILEAEDEEEDISDFQKEMRAIDPSKLKEFLDDMLAHMDTLGGLWVLTTYSDFEGTAIERSNADYLLKKYPGIVTSIKGPAFNTIWIGILDSALQNIDAEALHSLQRDFETMESKGILDEKLYKEIQYWKITEAWANWVLKNFRHDLAQKFPEYEEVLHQMSDTGLLRALFEDARDVSGEEWMEQPGAEQIVNVENVVNAVTKEMLQRWIAANVPGPQAESLLEGRQYSCVMAPAPPKLADAVIRWGQMFISDDELYQDPQDPDGFGREDEAHVTVKFGLHEAEPGEELLRIIEETQPFEIEIGPATIFDNDKYDVVKFDVDSDALRKLNERISELPNSDEYPQYKPHMTVAYVVKGTCHELIGKPLLEPQYEPDFRFLVKAVEFSSPNKTKTMLFLGKPNLGESVLPYDEILGVTKIGDARSMGLTNETGAGGGRTHDSTFGRYHDSNRWWVKIGKSGKNRITWGGTPTEEDMLATEAHLAKRYPNIEISKHQEWLTGKIHKLLGEADRRANVPAVTNKAASKPTGGAGGTLAKPTLLNVDKLPKSKMYQVMPAGVSNPFANQRFGEDKFFMTPQGRFVEIVDHEPSAAALLGQKKKSHDSWLDRFSSQLHDMGWIRIVFGDPYVTFSWRASQSQIEQLTNICIENRLVLVDDRGRWPKEIYVPPADEPPPAPDMPVAESSEPASADEIAQHLMGQVKSDAEEGWIDYPNSDFSLEWEWWGPDCIADAMRRGHLPEVEYEELSDDQKEAIFSKELSRRLPALSKGKVAEKIWWEFRDDGPSDHDAIGFILWKRSRSRS